MPCTHYVYVKTEYAALTMTFNKALFIVYT